MRVSWKATAENLVTYMSRDDMQRAYDSLSKRLQTERYFELHERDEIAQTLKFLAVNIAEYDASIYSGD